MTKPTLDPRPARILTSRECAKIIGSVLGGLVQMSDRETVRSALKWWLENPGALDALKAFEQKRQD